MGLPYREEKEIMIVGRTMWTQSTSVADRQTDRQTDRITITKTAQRIASRGKNERKRLINGQNYIKENYVRTGTDYRPASTNLSRRSLRYAERE